MTIQSYLNETKLPFPFCPGCGHGAILEHLNQALVELQLDPSKVVIVTDIGCCGLSDKFFITNALHGLHGRSVTYATGIKLAHPELTVIVLMGDGGCGIGGHHLINAARRNIGVTVLVFNNLNYGMTGGEHSVTTLPDANTATTWYGSLERPMDVCATVAVNGASFVARGTSFDGDLSDVIIQAIKNDGFSLIDIWELCTAHFAPRNRFGRKSLERAMDALGFKKGVVQHAPRDELSLTYRNSVISKAGDLVPTLAMEAKYRATMQGNLCCVIAGSAGMKIASAATMLCQGAVLSGLWATQRNDYPVTVKSGHSVSEVILSEKRTQFASIEKPDLMIVLSSEGLNKAEKQITSLTEHDVLWVNSCLMPISSRARIVTVAFERTGKRKEFWSVMCLAQMLREMNIYPLEALKEAISLRPEYADEYLDVVDIIVNTSLDKSPK